MTSIGRMTAAALTLLWIVAFLWGGATAAREHCGKVADEAAERVDPRPSP